MALTPIDEIHALQIQAGTLGRKAGHAFEDKITNEINSFQYPMIFEGCNVPPIYIGNPARTLLRYISIKYNIPNIESAVALSTGALATSEEGKKWLEVNGVAVRRCKSDLIINIKCAFSKEIKTLGISTKQCNNKNPTNAQLYFTTAIGFSRLLNENGIIVSERAIKALRQFCGDNGFRPLDCDGMLLNRKVDPRRYFWEEIDLDGRKEWEDIFVSNQNEITRLLLQKAYLDDPFSPDIILHKTKKAISWEQTEVAIYAIDELVRLSSLYNGFWKKPYSVKKGAYKDPDGVRHDAPRFGIVQMQRGGQKQHPDQLQFNLEAGYFYKIG